MTTEDVTTRPTDEDNEQRWWKLLRRAFEIPDIVSNKNSEDVVTTALLNSPLTPEQEKISAMGERLAQETGQWREKTARAVVRTIVKMGDQGDLDELFVPLSLNPQSKDAISAKVAGGLEDAEPFVDMVLTRVTAYVKGPQPTGPLEAD